MERLFMKNFTIIMPIMILFACAGTTTKQNLPIVHTGWNDDDTYTVKVSDSDEDKAVQRAKHKILKDIIDIRIRISSKFTDIIKIREEFDLPLNHGIIISRQRINDGVLIYFQIRDKDLKKKFQKK